MVGSAGRRHRSRLVAAAAIATSSLLVGACGTAPTSSPADHVGAGTGVTAAPAADRTVDRAVDRTALAVLAAKAARVAETARLASSTGPNPLAGRIWGVYKGSGEPVWTAYQAATPAQQAQLAYLADAPKARWFGSWIPTSAIAAKVRAYIANSQAGDPDALVQMAVFRMVPWEHAACTKLPTAAQARAYRAWINQFAAAVGDAHVALILQPDGPFALCVPHRSTRSSGLVAYAAKRFAALPNTSVYLDAGAADWPHDGAQGGVAAAVGFLVPAGVAYVRGIALDSTHYSATSDEIARGAAIVRALAARGIADKHVVINTSSNGHPFEFGTYTGTNPDNAKVCPPTTTPATVTCVTLGIPPTAEVTNPRWGLDPTTTQLAATYVDGFLWFGRPWLYDQASPFQMSRALGLIASTPWRTH